MKELKVTAKWVSAVIVAAGGSSRMDGIDKLFHPVGGDELPLLVHTIRAFQRCTLIREIIIVTRSEHIADVAGFVRDYEFDKAAKIVEGGADRSDSVQIGLREVNDKADFVAIHDGARPLVTPKLISEVVLGATATGAAIAAIPVTDTIKHVMGGYIKRTVPRKTLYEAQTPQVFDVGLIKGALYNAKVKKLAITDDSQAVEALGIPVRIVEGSRANIKVTYAEDFLAVNIRLDLEGGNED
ncbi:MAG: 2-C-methyl-D-erythritol 4-phosphate cytidylyltransferase [Oscillospiraceae bacterium]|nr:2-C-methyl-D-erythritol 4-phosphate cytidylyltransferase [Oscillospiraceae bacterium]